MYVYNLCKYDMNTKEKLRNLQTLYKNYISAKYLQGHMYSQLQLYFKQAGIYIVHLMAVKMTNNQIFTLGE